MSGDFNKVILMGRLTRDPELVYTQANYAICKFGLAVNRRFKDWQTEEWKSEAHFFDVAIFGKRGEHFAKYHSKGSAAFIDGELRYRTWEDKETGGKRSAVSVVANDWQFVSASPGGGGGGRDYAPATDGAQGGGGEDHDPATAGAQGGGGGGGGSYEPANAGSGGGGGENLEVDDTPF
jgi:single-strand DNA-binding protein